MPSERVTIAEGGRREGISKQRAYMRAKTGKVTVGKDGLVDPVQATKEWNEKRDLKQSMRGAYSGKKRPDVPSAAEVLPTAGADPETDALLKGPLQSKHGRSLADAQLAREFLRLKKEKLHLDLMEGKLIDANDVRKAINERVTVEREWLLNLPARIASNMAAALGVEERPVQYMLDKEIRTFLAERATHKWQVLTQPTS